MPQLQMKVIIAALLLCGHASYAQENTSSPIIDVASGCDEEFTGNAMDYRGCQTKTRRGFTCQDWSSQYPRAHPTITPALYPNAGLVYNFCRNPNGAGTIWCYTLDPVVAVDFCDPVGPRSSPSRSPVRSPSPRRSASPKPSRSPGPSESPEESDSPSSSESTSESPDESDSPSTSPVPSPSPSPPTPSPSPSPHYQPDVMELAKTPADLRLSFHFSMQYIIIVPFIDVSKPLNVYFTCSEDSPGFAVPPTFTLLKYRSSNANSHAQACSAGIKMIYDEATCDEFLTTTACKATIVGNKFQTLGTFAGSLDLTYIPEPSHSDSPSASRSRSTSALPSRSRSPRASGSPSISYSPSESPDESDSPSTSESAEESDSPSSSPSTSPDESDSPSTSPDESDSPSSSQSQSQSPSPRTPSPSSSPVYDPEEVELAITPPQLYLNYSYSSHHIVVIPLLNVSKPLVVYFRCGDYKPPFAMPERFGLIEYHRTTAATHADACANGIKLMTDDCDNYVTELYCTHDLSGKFKTQSEAGPGYVELDLEPLPSPSPSRSPRRSASPIRSVSPSPSDRTVSRSMSRRRSPSRSRYPSPSPEESNSPSPVSASPSPSRSRSPSPRSPSRSPSPRKSKYNEADDAAVAENASPTQGSESGLYALFVMIPMTVVGVLVAWKLATRRKQENFTTTLDFQPDVAGERVMPCPSVEVPMSSARPSSV